MQLGLVGLGRMGGNMARRLMAGGHEIVAWDERADAVRALELDGPRPRARSTIWSRDLRPPGRFG